VLSKAFCSSGRLLGRREPQEENMPTITGTSGNDTLTGSFDSDSIYGLEGDDTIDGGESQDWLYGGEGNDTIFTGGSGSYLFPDYVRDGPGNDSVFGGFGQVAIFGSPGNDIYDGGNEGWSDFDEVFYSDALAGILIDLRLATGQVRSLASGDAARIGMDTLVNIEAVHGTDFSDTMYATGGAGNLVLHGAGGNDLIFGNTGHDIMFGGAGDDFIDGGNGIDNVDFGESASGVHVSLLITGPQDTGEGLDTILNVEGVSGTWFDDVLIGNDGDGYFFGGLGGNDQIFGGGGDDFIEVIEGTNLLDGGNGDDLIISAGGTDVINGGAGDDEIWAGYGALIRGGAGNDMLNGSNGLDTADYSDAIDLVTVSLLSHFAIEYVAPGLDEYYEDSLYDIENVIGGNFNDTLFGDDWHNHLEGGLGNDSLGGWHGDDVLIGGDGNDTLTGGMGEDVLTGGNGNDRFEDLSGDLSGDTITDFGLGAASS
jgi:Ca2+-binding RTX toxin-like protein